MNLWFVSVVNAVKEQFRQFFAGGGGERFALVHEDEWLSDALCAVFHTGVAFKFHHWRICGGGLLALQPVFDFLNGFSDTQFFVVNTPLHAHGSLPTPRFRLKSLYDKD